MPINFLCGAWCENTVPSAGAPSDACHWTGAAGTPSILTSSDWPGGKAYRCAASGAAVNMVRTVTFASSARVGVARMRVSSLPAAERVIMRVATATGSIDISITSGGVLKAGVTGGTFQTGPTVTNTQIFRVGWKIVTSATTWTIDWEVDGVAQTQATRTGMTAGNMTSMTIGAIEASTYTVDFTDVMETTRVDEYPIGNGYAKGRYITGDGTHSVGIGAFRDSGGTNITNATTNAYTFVDDITPVGSGTDYVEQQTIDAAGYLEFTLGSATEPQAPYAVAVVGVVSEASAAGAHVLVALTFGALERQSVDILGAGGTVKQDFGVVYATTVGSATDQDIPWYGTYSWSQARVRWGYSADANPDVRLHGMAVEAWYPVTTSALSVVAIGPHDFPDGTRTSTTLTMPSGILTDDVEYASVSKDYVNEVITAPAGWTLIGSRQDATTLHSVAVYRRIAPDNSEAGDTHTWSWATAVVGGVSLIVVRGNDTTTPEITFAQQANASSGTPPIPALTATAQDMLLIGIIGMGRGGTSVEAPPVGWALADFAADNLTTAAGASTALIYRHYSSANPPSVSTVFANGSVTAAFQIAVGIPGWAGSSGFVWGAIL